ncbi:hypothetical protein J4E81_007711 [Alternaria sp. BMP 2799]|nr:hypothetical protein J4E81_007711 [Alternaria sp. BMP 2799]
MDKRIISRKERERVELRKLPKDLRRKKECRKVIRQILKQRKALSFPSGENPGRDDNDCAERGIQQIEARLNQQLQQGHRPLVPLKLATYILTAKSFIKDTTDGDGNCIHDGLVHDDAPGRLYIEKISRQGDDVEVKANLWFKLGTRTCLKEQVEFTGSWPDLEIPALEEISVKFCDESQVRYRGASQKQKEMNQESMRITLVFLRDGYLSMRAQAVPFYTIREDIEFYGIKTSKIKERDSGLIERLEDSDPETTEPSDEDTTDSESDSDSDIWYSDYDKARAKHAKQEARGKAIEAWLEERIASGEEETVESMEARRTSLEDYNKVLKWNLWSTSYLDMLVAKKGWRTDNELFHGGGCGDFSITTYGRVDDRPAKGTLTLPPQYDHFPGDLKWTMERSVVNSKRLNAIMSTEDSPHKLKFRICFVENGHMKIRIPAHEIRGSRENGLIDFYAIAEDLPGFRPHQRRRGVVREWWEKTPDGLVYNPPTGAIEDSRSECSDHPDNLIDGQWDNKTSKDKDGTFNRISRIDRVNCTKCYQDAMKYYSHTVQSFDGKYENLHFEDFIAGMRDELLAAGVHRSILDFVVKEHVGRLKEARSAKSAVTEELVLPERGQQYHATHTVHDDTETNENAPASAPLPEQDDPLSNDSERAYWAALPDGESESDSGSDEDVLDDSTPTDHDTFSQHLEWMSKGWAVTRWLIKEKAQGREHPVGNIKGEWVLYSDKHIQLGPTTCKDVLDRTFKPGRLVIRDCVGEDKIKLSFQMFYPIITPVLDFGIQKVDVPFVVEEEPVYCEDETGFTKGLRFLGNGYLTLHMPASLVGGEGSDMVEFFAVSRNRDEHAREMEWARGHYGWVYQPYGKEAEPVTLASPFQEIRVPVTQTRRSYEEDDYDLDDGFCYYEDKEMQCCDDDCPKHSRMDEREW